MKKIIYSVLALVVGFVLSGAGCNQDAFDPNGVEIGGVIWAKYNVDTPNKFAAEPEDPGMLYQWNRKIGWSAEDPIASSQSGKSWDGTTPNGTTWEAVNDPCPTGWRVPTSSELNALMSSFNLGWVTVGSVSGRKYGSDSDFIFLRAAGRRMTTGGLADVGSWGWYWSNEQSNINTSNARYYGFTASSSPVSGTDSKAIARSVRCVKKSKR